MTPDDFPKIACDEEVYSETSLKNPIAPGGGMGRNDTVRQFRYIIIPKLAGDIPVFHSSCYGIGDLTFPLR